MEQEPFELRQRVQFHQKSAYSVIPLFAMCIFDFDDEPLHQLGPHTIRSNFSLRHSAGLHVPEGE